jgi:hypothetical protein
MLSELAEKHYHAELTDLLDVLGRGRQVLQKCVEFVKENGNEYMDLYGKNLVDIAIYLICGYLFCGQASSKVDMEVAVAGENSQQNGTMSMKSRKAIFARRYISRNAAKIKALAEVICAGDKSTFTDYSTMVGPVPSQD